MCKITCIYRYFFLFFSRHHLPAPQLLIRRSNLLRRVIKKQIESRRIASAASEFQTRPSTAGARAGARATRAGTNHAGGWVEGARIDAAVVEHVERSRRRAVRFRATPSLASIRPRRVALLPSTISRSTLIRQTGETFTRVHTCAFLIYLPARPPIIAACSIYFFPRFVAQISFVFSLPSNRKGITRGRVSRLIARAPSLFICSIIGETLEIVISI